MKVRAHVFISGDVQGVFFRSYTRREANKLSVKGWVRNLRDGRVEAVYEGDIVQVNKMIDLCRKGPPHARVKTVNVKWEKPQGEFQNFKIDYF